MSPTDIATITLRSLDETKIINEDILFDELTAVVAYKPTQVKNQRKILYWTLPVAYCGDKVDINAVIWKFL